MSEQQTTPVTADATATAPQLIARAADDYADAQARRQQRATEDRVNGQQTGGQR